MQKIVTVFTAYLPKVFSTIAMTIVYVIGIGIGWVLITITGKRLLPGGSTGSSWNPRPEIGHRDRMF